MRSRAVFAGIFIADRSCARKEEEALSVQRQLSTLFSGDYHHSDHAGRIS